MKNRNPNTRCGDSRSRRCIALILLSAVASSACKEDGGTDSDPSGGPGPVNQAPTISGTPPTSVKVGEDYSFQPNASDPDGDTLTFSAFGDPSWTTFDASTGLLSGIPQAGDEGVYEDISIEVTDGSASDALGFSVTVTQTAPGSVTLSWNAPTQNTDGSILNDLAAFNLYYGKSPGSYTEEIEVDNPGLTTYVVENLSPDTYYFAATAVNSSGLESDLSSPAILTVD